MSSSQRVSYQPTNQSINQAFYKKFVEFANSMLPTCMIFFANTFQIQPFHKGLVKQADVAFCFMPGA
jgi:hypothetical protein